MTYKNIYGGKRTSRRHFRQKTIKSKKHKKSNKHKKPKKSRGGSTRTDATKKIQANIRRKLVQTRNKKNKLARKFINKLQKLKNKRDKCPLCVAPIYDGDERVKYHTTCGSGHEFHPQCAEKPHSYYQRARVPDKCPSCRGLPARTLSPVLEPDLGGVDPNWRENERRPLDEEWDVSLEDEPPITMFGLFLGREVEDLFYYIDMQLIATGILPILVERVRNIPENFTPQLRAAIIAMNQVAEFINLYPNNYSDEIIPVEDEVISALDMDNEWRERLGSEGRWDAVNMRRLRQQYNLVITSPQFLNILLQRMLVISGVTRVSLPPAPPTLDIPSPGSDSDPDMTEEEREEIWLQRQAH